MHRATSICTVGLQNEEWLTSNWKIVHTEAKVTCEFFSLGKWKSPQSYNIPQLQFEISPWTRASIIYLASLIIKKKKTKNLNEEKIK